MGRSQRDKGKRGERELARVLSSYGYDCHRGQQNRGGGDSPDVVGLDGVHVECKRVEALNVEKAMEQARRDSEGSGNLPVVMHRKNGEPWKATCDLSTFMLLYSAWRAMMGYEKPEPRLHP